MSNSLIIVIIKFMACGKCLCSCSRRIIEGRDHYLSVGLTSGMLGRRKTIIHLKRYEVKNLTGRTTIFSSSTHPTQTHRLLCIFVPCV